MDIVFLGAEEQLEALPQAGVQPANLSALSQRGVAWACSADRAEAGAPLQ